MGARFFTHEATGDSPADTYRNAINEAIMEHGIEAYSGTINVSLHCGSKEAAGRPRMPQRLQTRWSAKVS